MVLSEKFYNRFINYGFDAYIQTFKDYFHNIPQEQQKTDLQALCNNLDSTSVENVERLLFLMKKLPLPSKDFLVKYDSIYSEKEQRKIREEQKFNATIEQVRKRYHFKDYHNIEMNVFKYHCGLKLLPKDVLSTIKDGIAIDVGAFIGDSTVIINKYRPKTIIAFEPNSVNFQELQQTIVNNSLQEKVVAENYGIGLVNDKKTMYYLSNKKNHGASFVFKAFHSIEETVNIINLDEYYGIQKHNNLVSLIKIDAEGMGLAVVKSCKELIKAHKPIIICSIYHNIEELMYVKTYLESFLIDYNFQIFSLNEQFVLKELTLIGYKNVK